jgi:hypothetical protein
LRPDGSDPPDPHHPPLVGEEHIPETKEHADEEDRALNVFFCGFGFGLGLMNGAVRMVGWRIDGIQLQPRGF